MIYEIVKPPFQKGIFFLSNVHDICRMQLVSEQR